MKGVTKKQRHEYLAQLYRMRKIVHSLNSRIKELEKENETLRQTTLTSMVAMIKEGAAELKAMLVNGDMDKAIEWLDEMINDDVE